MNIYTLVNYGTGEISTIKADSPQMLYNRADSLRRECIRYNMPQDTIKLFCGDVIIAVWAGGMDTPLEALGLDMEVYKCLYAIGLRTIGDLAQYAYTKDIDLWIDDKKQYKIAKIIMLYDKNAACKLIRKLNNRRFKR